MQRITKNSSLFDSAPDLVKEWHPSANGTLTPRTVTISFAKQLWWICSESHEWQSTIKARMRGHGCPQCHKSQGIEHQSKNNGASTSKNVYGQKQSTLQSDAAVFEPDIYDDKLGYDFRKSPRYKMRATAVLETYDRENLMYADVKNFSAGGIGFETDACIDPGTKIRVKLNRPLYISDRKNYDSIIKWCKVFDNDSDSFATFGLGVQFI